jgi:hypothetical protein
MLAALTPAFSATSATLSPRLRRASRRWVERLGFLATGVFLVCLTREHNGPNGSSQDGLLINYLKGDPQMRLNEIVNPEGFAKLVSDVEKLVSNIERIWPADDLAYVLDFDKLPNERLDEP